MNIKPVLFLCFLFICNQPSFATHKIYILHEYGGSLIQMDKINKGLKHEGYDTENYTYPGFTESIDSIGHDLYVKVKYENYDTVSFVTHPLVHWWSDRCTSILTQQYISRLSIGLSCWHPQIKEPKLLISLPIHH